MIRVWVDEIAPPKGLNVLQKSQKTDDQFSLRAKYSKKTPLSDRETSLHLLLSLKPFGKVC